jgi:hypothetical protein
MSTKFKYLIRDYSRVNYNSMLIERNINILGDDGWELVSVRWEGDLTQCFFKKTINIIANTGPR